VVVGDEIMADTALIIVDMQNAFCSKNGSYQKRGNRLLNLEVVIDNTSVLLDHFRNTNHRVIFTKKCFKTDYSDIGLLGKLHPEIIELNGLREGSWDTEIIRELEPSSGEVVFVNNTYDPFYNTFLEDWLKGEGINRLVICGVVANICVQATLIGAFVREIEPVLVKECTTSTSQSLLDAVFETVSNAFGWLTSLEDVLTKEKSELTAVTR
jgi:ureidoacrylate peracid hydrolase